MLQSRFHVLLLHSYFIYKKNLHQNMIAHINGKVLRELRQEPITEREGALNLCMYADSTCCRMALAQNSLYGKSTPTTVQANNTY